METIFKRKSSRNFLSKKIENEKIDKLLKAAMAAPTARNQQPWEFYIVENEVKLIKLSNSSDHATPIRSATIAIVPCYNKNVPVPVCASLDLSAATQNILLEAEYLELGAVWIGVYPFEERINKVKDILKLPEDIIPFAIIPIGYPSKETEVKNKFDENKIHYIK